MLYFTVEQAPAMQLVEGCIKCCCASWSVKPGTVEKAGVGYAPWVLPIGRLHCAPQFVLEQQNTCPPQVGTNSPPRPATPVAFDVAVNATLNGDLNAQVVDPEGDPLTYKQKFPYGPHHGKLALDPTGQFIYTPDSNYRGPDDFYVQVSDGVNSPVVFEVVIGVGVPSANIPATPHVSIVADGVQIDQRYHQISFPIRITPAAQLCEVWRLIVFQEAIDCDNNCYNRNDCIDLRIAKC